MAYDRYDRDSRTRPYGRDRFSDLNEDRFTANSDRRDERGWFERAGDEVASWFGDDDAERRRRQDYRGERGDYRTSDYGSGNYSRDRFDRSDRSPQSNRHDTFLGDRYVPRGDFDRDERRGFITSDRFRGERDARLGTFGSRALDPQYHDWRQRQIDDLDRDYDEYRQENQARFENEFGTWRERRQSKRAMLKDIREHMDVVGADDEHVGTIDRVAGDRVILTKSDPDAGGVHHSFSCSDIDRVEDNRVILDFAAADAKTRWRDESRSRALFEREDQGEAGPRILDRSFEGTYR